MTGRLSARPRRPASGSSSATRGPHHLPRRVRHRGALGVPGLTRRRSRFHDVRLSSAVLCARQALAIDERRLTFEPCLWDVPTDDDRVGGVKQVWFPGGHSDVGRDSLARTVRRRAPVDDGEAAGCGLAFYRTGSSRSSATTPSSSAGSPGADVPRAQHRHAVAAPPAVPGHTAAAGRGAAGPRVRRRRAALRPRALLSADPRPLRQARRQHHLVEESADGALAVEPVPILTDEVRPLVLA
ncbi:DUF2235 domain-containing protein [Oerskovia sp. M15]